MLSVFDFKLISILIVYGGSMFFGLLPGWLSLGTRFKNSVLLSSLLCFGGGVLLATSLVHILPEIRNDLNKWSEVVFCLGFMFIYLTDVVLQLFQGASCQGESHQIPQTSYGSINTDNVSILSFNSNLDDVQFEFKCTNFSLIAAFSIHSLLEGLVIGVEPTTRGVILLLVAVCCHKLVVAFCLGSELCIDGRPTYQMIPPLSVFALGSALGIAIGSVFQADKIPGIDILVPILQGLAGGTLLYIVMSEILPRERARKLPNIGILAQYFSVLIGFGFMTAVSIWA